MNFVWDENKNQINRKKHGIDFTEARSVFFLTNRLFYLMTLNIPMMKKDF